MSEWTSAQIVKLLRERYKSPETSFNKSVVLEEVANGTGGHQSRWIDVAVFDMWPSKGLNRSAFEIKVSRADFINELRQPEKHQWCKECFHYFWFVAPKDVIQEPELPTNAGWMYPAGNRLCIKRHAVRNDNPRLDDKLLAAFMRAAGKSIDSAYRVAAVSALADSREYKQALTYEKAAVRFLTSCKFFDRHFKPLEDEEQIIKALESATTDEKLKSDREHLDYKLGIFEREISDLLDTFILIASKSLIARDKFGSHIFEAPDKAGFLHKHVKEHKNEIKELLLKLDRELEPAAVGGGRS